MLSHLLSITLAIALRAHATAVLVTLSDATCNNTASDALFSISVNDQCQVMHYVEAFNIDMVAPGCSVWLYHDSVCTTNEHLAPAVGVCIKQNTSETSLKVICSGTSTSSGSSMLAATSGASTTSASHSASTGTATPTTASSSPSTTTSNALSKPAQIALATILPLAGLVLVCIFGFRTWAKYRHGGYASPQPNTNASSSPPSGTYSWEKNTPTAMAGKGMAGVREEEEALGATDDTHGELPSREFDDPRELAGRRAAAEMA